MAASTHLARVVATDIRTRLKPAIIPWLGSLAARNQLHHTHSTINQHPSIILPSPLSSSRIYPCMPSLIISTPSIRHKTYRKKQSKPMQKVLKKMAADPVFAAAKKRKGPYQPVMENKFWKVVGDMKVYKDVTPGTRNRRHPVRFHLHRGSAIKRLSFGKRSTGGRNNHGRVTIRHRGGGHKRRVRIVDFVRNVPGPHEVVRLEYDPNRSADLALLRCLSTNEFSYIIRPDGLQPGAMVESWRGGIPETPAGQEPISKARMIRDGNCLLLKDIPAGTIVHCISLTTIGPAKMCRSAGTSGQLLQVTDEGMAHVRVSSKEVRMVPATAVATIGVVCNANHNQRIWGKAGSRRHRGWRPSVRLKAMSPYDGMGSGAGRGSPWGKMKRGWKTVRKPNSMVITPRWKAKLRST
ncbi:hypothetical protein SmJEL517_g05554 [Synchytrium microbalum]|uniref:Uncharacterized protein n=1 Tax=Synchytrium microbalum TaxID=1806994 RepID=A0A507BUY5_9FUNG|nr:uncharacterized protein SmJEL517_g05554 [Synchytrium microbalum]TPX31001.1 hypothetical protein SmJEL517_g05554 [Synchytrium microbalum]